MWHLFSTGEHMFGSMAAQSPAHYTSTLIRASFPRLVARGMKVRKVSDHELLLEDIDEWLWSDQQTVQRTNKYEICFDVYACNNNGVDTLRGIVVGITVIEPPRFLWWWKFFLSLISCMVLLFWTQAIYFTNIIDTGDLFQNCPHTGAEDSPLSMDNPFSSS